MRQALALGADPPLLKLEKGGPPLQSWKPLRALSPPRTNYLKKSGNEKGFFEFVILFYSYFLLYSFLNHIILLYICIMCAILPYLHQKLK